jgi:hypothetical protein
MIAYDRFFNFNVTPVTKNGTITTDPLCNALTVINTGSTIIYFNEIPLNPGVPGVNNGESFTLGGNKGEYFEGRAEIRFPAGLSNGSALVIEKVYLPKC